jgi:hypothetical protein
MKALFTCCLASLLLLAGAHPGHAAVPLAVVNFSVERSLPFSLTLDGQPLTRSSAQPVHLDNLAPGQHQVELDLGPTTARGRRMRPVRATVWLEEGLETSFVLTQRPGSGWQLRQVSTAALPGYGYADQVGTYAQPTPEPEAAYNVPPTAAAYPPASGPAYPAAPGYPPVAPAYPTGAAYPGAYPPINSDVAGLVQALKQCSFDDKRLPIFYQAISRSYVRADDLALMVRTMTYSDSQRQVAEFGYGHLSDPQNFHRVLAALTFSTDASTVLDNLGLQRR